MKSFAVLVMGLLKLAAVAEAAGAVEAPFACTIANYTPEYKKGVMVKGVERTLTFYWHDEVSRAASALMRAAVAAAGYVGLRSRRAPPDLCAAPADLHRGSVLAVSWALNETVASRNAEECRRRLRVVGAAPPPAALRLHVRLAPAPRAPALAPAPASATTRCAGAPSRPLHLQNETLTSCDLFSQSGNRAEVYVLKQDHANFLELCLGNLTSMFIMPAQILNRTILIDKVINSSDTFFFFDYDLWSQNPDVHTVTSIPNCSFGLNAPRGYSVVDDKIQSYYPDINEALRNFNPTARHIRQVLEKEVNTGDIAQAACEWGREHKATFSQWVPSTYHMEYGLGVVLCSEGNEDEKSVYRQLLGNIDTDWTDYNITLYYNYLDCNNLELPEQYVQKYDQSVESYSLIGMVVSSSSSKGAITEAHKANMPLMLVRDEEGAVGGAGAVEGGARVAGPGQERAAAALGALVRRAGWARLALVTRASAADASRPHLRGLVVEYVDPYAGDGNATDLLSNLKQKRARVVVLNVDKHTTTVLLREAEKLDMTEASGFVWIVCGEPIPKSAVHHLALSFWSREYYNSLHETENGALHTLVLRNWTYQSVPLVYALQTLIIGFKNFYHDYPELRNDLRNEDAIRLFWKSYDNSPANGFGEQLNYERGALRDPRIFILSCGGAGSGSEPCQLRGAWRAGSWLTWRSGALTHGWPLFADGSAPSDGDIACIVRRGDPFNPDCDDLFVFGGSILVLAAFAVVTAYARFAYKRQLARHKAKYETEVRLRLQEWKERAAGALAGYLVDRNDLEIDGKLGEGRFGFVQFAILRNSSTSPRPVAVKALREGAAPSEESDFLREASMLASLEHENIIRFVGVCAGDGPPLVLMEYAFFGDLLGYLQARRYLVEGVIVDTDTAAEGELNTFGVAEVEHVSASALTRLAREAASALGYLASRGVVHRDVRASNCLLDSRRTLKLSDFGLARRLGGEAAGDGAEYACRRRGLFPVLWMAPESLKEGVFSTASDVWSFGVLVLELVTLGARPFGDWPPLRVLQFVTAGGQPPLPPAAAPHARALAALCWRRRAEQRPAAAALVAYLGENARALRPAPWPRRGWHSAASASAVTTALADADSAFSESPSNEEGDSHFAFASSPRSLPIAGLHAH